MASSSTKAAFSAVSTAGKWTRSPLNGHNFQRGSWRGGSQDRTWQDGLGGGGTGADICLTGGPSLSSHWVVVRAGRVGGWSVLLNPFFKCHRGWSEETSGAAKHKFVYVLTKAAFFLAGGWGGKRVPSGLAFPFSNSSLQKCHANYRPNSLYADATTRLWSTRCWMQQHETGQNLVSCRSACEQFPASQQLTLDVQVFNEQVAS